MRKKLPVILLLLALFLANLSQAQSNNLFFVFLNTNPDKEQLGEEKAEQLQAAHLQNIDRLAKEGIIRAAGPFEDGGGFLILNTEDEESAKTILQTDPAIKANRFNPEIFPLMLANNDLCGAKEPYEMVTYQFVRTIFNLDYFGDVDIWFAENRVFMADLNNRNDFVIAQGNFNNYNDGFLILDVEDARKAENIIRKHPAVKEGQINYEIKSLYIAKGTFCKR